MTGTINNSPRPGGSPISCSVSPGPDHRELCSVWRVPGLSPGRPDKCLHYWWDWLSCRWAVKWWRGQWLVKIRKHWRWWRMLWLARYCLSPAPLRWCETGAPPAPPRPGPRYNFLILFCRTGAARLGLDSTPGNDPWQINKRSAADKTNPAKETCQQNRSASCSHLSPGPHQPPGHTSCQHQQKLWNTRKLNTAHADESKTCVGYCLQCAGVNTIVFDRSQSRHTGHQSNNFTLLTLLPGKLSR